MEPMIPRALKDKLHKMFVGRKILANQPIYKDIMALVAPEHIDPRTWIYDRKGIGQLVSRKEAEEMYATGDYADHPHGPVVDTNEDGGDVRDKEAWEGDESVPDKESEKDMTVVRDDDGKMTNPTKDSHTRDELVAIAVGLGLNPPDNAVKKDIVKLIDENS